MRSFMHRATYASLALCIGLAFGCQQERQLDLFVEEPKGAKPCMDPMGCPKPEPECKGADCACSVDADCPKEHPACAAGLCVACTLDQHCPPEQACNVALRRCARECSEAAACDKAAHCHAARGYCVECVSELHCTKPERPACETDAGVCVAAPAPSDGAVAPTGG
jgi:hypothetical protein